MSESSGTTYRPWDPERSQQGAYRPADKLPEGDLVCFLLDTGSQLDLGRFYAPYEPAPRGAPPYHPVMMTCLLIYAYCVGVFSSRKSALACERTLAFIAIVGDERPDFRTISDFRTRHQVALEMLAKNGAGLPHGWMSGDDEMGRPYGFRRRRATLGERYVLAVPSNTTMRDLETEPPASSGRGRRPTRPWHSVEAWSQSRDDEAWHSIDVRDGRKGPLVVEALKRRVMSRTHRRQPGDEEMLVVIRDRDRDQQAVVTGDYDLSNATPETSVRECARVAKAAHRIEECMQRSKSEAGLADYEVRNWTGWQHHQTLAFLATWFLVRETARGKKMDPCDDRTADSSGHRDDCARGVSVWHHAAYAPGDPEATATQ